MGDHHNGLDQRHTQSAQESSRHRGQMRTGRSMSSSSSPRKTTETVPKDKVMPPLEVGDSSPFTPLLKSLRRRGGGGDSCFLLPHSTLLGVQRVMNVLPNVIHRDLHSPGFLAGADLRKFRAAVILIALPDSMDDVSGDLVEGVEHICAELNSNSSSPPITLALCLSGVQRPDPNHDVPKILQELISWIMGCGADGVLCSSPANPVTYAQLSIQVQTLELLAEREVQAQREVQASCEQRMERNLQISMRKAIWSMPEKVFKHIPQIDKHLQETADSVGQYKLSRSLGKGTFSSVKLAAHPTHGQVAMKIINKALIRNVEDLAMTENEMSILIGCLNHPNVVRIIECIHTEAHLYIAMTFLGDYTLDAYVRLRQPAAKRNTSRFGFREVQGIYGDLLQALGHCHSRCVCHRDLKFRNLMITSNGRVTLVDFGLAVRVAKTQFLHDSCGTVPFAAPEVLLVPSDGYDGFAADVWSLGIVLLELVCGLGTVEDLVGLKRSDVDNFDHIGACVSKLAKPDMQAKAVSRLGSDVPDAESKHMAEALDQMFQLEAAYRSPISSLSTLPAFAPHVGPLAAGADHDIEHSLSPRNNSLAVPAPHDRHGKGGHHRNKRLTHRPRRDHTHAARNASDSVLEAVGGAVALRKVVGATYDYLVPRPEFARFFAACPMKMGRIRAGIESFLLQMLQDHKSCDLVQLRNQHQHLCISDARFNEFCRALNEAFFSIGVHGEVAVELSKLLEELREPITCGYRDRLAQHDAVSVPLQALETSPEEFGKRFCASFMDDGRIDTCPTFRPAESAFEAFAKLLWEGSVQAACEAIFLKTAASVSSVAIICSVLAAALTAEGMAHAHVVQVTLQVEFASERLVTFANKTVLAKDATDESRDWFVLTLKKLCSSDPVLQDFAAVPGIDKCFASIFDLALGGDEVFAKPEQLHEAHRDRGDLTDGIFNALLEKIKAVLQTLFPWPTYSASVTVEAVKAIEMQRSWILTSNGRARSYLSSGTFSSFQGTSVPGTPMPGSPPSAPGSFRSLKGFQSSPSPEVRVCPVTGKTSEEGKCPAAERPSEGEV